MNRPIYQFISTAAFNEGEIFYEGKYETCKSLYQKVDFKEWFAVVNKDSQRPVNPKFLEQ